MNITEFLLARIAEDEKPALDLWGGGGRWWATNADRVMNADILPAEHEMATQWDPARVLAECEAKRRIVELHRRVGLSPMCQCNSCGVASQNLGQRFPCRTLRALAAVYADHPDYNEAWRPA